MKSQTNSVSSQLWKMNVVTLLLLSLTIFSFGATSRAKESLPSFTRVLSYDEVMALSPSKRAQYVAGLRKMFAVVDRTNANKIALLEVPEIDERAPASVGLAPANLVSCGPGESAFRDLGQGRKLCKKGRSQTTPCASGYVGVFQDPDSGAFSCVSRASFEAAPDYIRHDSRVSLYMPSLSQGALSLVTFQTVSNAQIAFKASGPNPETINVKPFTPPPAAKVVLVSGDQIVSDQEKSNPKLAASHLAALNKQRLKAGLLPLTKLPPPGPQREAARGRLASIVVSETVEKKAEPLISKPIVSEPKKLTLLAQKPATKPKPENPGIAKPVASSGNAEALRVRTPGQPKPQPAPVPALRVVTKPEPKPVAKLDPKSEAKPVPKPEATGRVIAVPIPVGEAEAALDAVFGATNKEQAASTNVMDAPDLVTCSLETSNKETCRAPAIEDARRKYNSDPNPDCIYAGSVGGYQDGRKRSFKCEPPHSFCFGSKSCRTEAGEPMKADYTCGPTAVICNPLLFGVKADAKTPFCVERGATATVNCEAKAAEATGSIQPLDEGKPGVREAWNDFADRLFKLCNSNPVAKELYCVECGVIRSRLFALNVAAREIKTCGAAVKYEAANCSADGKCQGRPGVGPAAPKPAGSNGSVTQKEVIEDRQPASGDERH